MNFPELKTLPTQEEVDELRAQVEKLQARTVKLPAPESDTEQDFLYHIKDALRLAGVRYE